MTEAEAHDLTMVETANIYLIFTSLSLLCLLSHSPLLSPPLSLLSLCALSPWSLLHPQPTLHSRIYVASSIACSVVCDTTGMQVKVKK